MKIFSKFYVRRLYQVSSLEDILTILIPWVSQILYENSPFLRQTASYYLRSLGGSYAPRFFKTILTYEILRLNEFEDLKASLLLAIIIAYRNYKPSKGNVSLVTWLAWMIPYEFSKLITWQVTHPITPFKKEIIPEEITAFEENFEFSRQVDIISKDLGLNKQTKHYYQKKVKD